jgi:hypothetical protein
MEQTTQQIAQKPSFPIKTKIAVWWMMILALIEMPIFINMLFRKEGGPGISIRSKLFYPSLILLIVSILFLTRKKWAWWLAIIMIISIISYWWMWWLNLYQIIFFQILISFFLLLLDRKNFWKIAS